MAAASSWQSSASSSRSSLRFGEVKKHDRNVVENAKERCRTDLYLKEWARQGHYKHPDRIAEPAPVGEMPRIHVDKCSVEDFRQYFEAPNVPVVVDGIVDKWSARKEWTFENLFEKYRHRRFKCGEDDDGNQVKIKLKYFLRYMDSQKDDSPLYIFDSHFPDDEKAKDMMQDFEVPEYFSDDLFKLVGEGIRPPYRWFLIGPKRSGTCTHIDPLATSAWNSLISGRKRWVLFPPETAKRFAKAKEWQRKADGEDDEAIDFFNLMLPRALEAAKKEGVPVRYIDYVQRPGETMFVPGGWWHAVLNLDDSVAVTQNFCSRVNFPRVWLATRSGRKRMARKWLPLLEQQWPELAAQAKALNQRDGFSMEPSAAERARAARRSEKAKARREKRAAKAARRSAADSTESDSSTSSSESSDTSDSDSDADVVPEQAPFALSTPWGGLKLHSTVPITGMQLHQAGQ